MHGTWIIKPGLTNKTEGGAKPVQSSALFSCKHTFTTVCSYIEVTLSCSKTLIATSSHQGLTTYGCDLSEELLSALSPEERELLGAITARGYPLHAAFMALQKTGQQTPDQVSQQMQYERWPFFILTIWPLISSWLLQLFQQKLANIQDLKPYMPLHYTYNIAAQQWVETKHLEETWLNRYVISSL